MVPEDMWDVGDVVPEADMGGVGGVGGVGGRLSRGERWGAGLGSPTGARVLGRRY